MTAVLRNPESSDLLKDALFIQHGRVRKMLAIQYKLGDSLPHGPKNLDSLTKILELIMQHEFGTASLLRKGGGVPAAFEMEKLSPVAQTLQNLMP